jgi:hypothetical protein
MKQMSANITKTKLIRCTCQHSWQDQTHGKRMRVHNLMTKDLPIEKWRCTVCGKVN